MTRATEGSAGPCHADGPSGRRSRRQAVALAGAVAAAATVAALGMERGNKAHAATGDPLIIGAPNEANPSDETQLTGDVGPKGTVLQVANLFEGPTSSIVGDGPNGATGVRGMSTGGPGVHASSENGPALLGVSGSPRDLTEADPGFSLGASPGVEGHSGSGPGVRGVSQSGPGVLGECASRSGVGVYADSEEGTGIVAFSHNWYGSAVYGVNVQPGPVSYDEDGVPIANGSGPGVQGKSDSGDAVFGWAKSGIGVHARAAPEGLALNVEGKARFSTAGTGVVLTGANAATVANPTVTAASHVTVTFMGNPGSARVAWVKRQPGTGFIVHLSGRPPRNVPFTYLIVETGR